MLVVKGLSFGYRARRLISNLSFELNPGEILHVIGPNGTGKSTLLQLLAGLIAAESGNIKWDKPESIEYLPAEANGLYLAMSARENLNFWRAGNMARTFGGLRLASLWWSNQAPVVDTLTWDFDSLTAVRTGLSAMNNSPKTLV